MVSIIVPIYNTEKYLRPCIESILAQTYQKFELLLVNDGSTDDSGVICDEYLAKDNRIRVFHKKNGGATSARKLALDNATGEYVMFVDSDDTIRKDALELLLASFDNNVDVVRANSDENIILSNVEWIKLLLNCKTRCELWGCLYKHTFLNKQQFEIPLSVKIGEDLLINILYALNVTNIKLVSDRIYDYNQNREMSLTNSYMLSLEHEKILLTCIDTILRGKEHIYAFEIFRKRYLTLERLIYLGYKPYREDWVKSLMLEKNKYKKSLGIKEKILLSVPCALFCRFVLKFGLFVKNHIPFESR